MKMKKVKGRDIVLVEGVIAIITMSSPSLLLFRVHFSFYEKLFYIPAKLGSANVHLMS